MPLYEGTTWGPSVDRALDRFLNNKWVPLAANLAALMLLIYGLAQWTWRLLQPPAAPATVTLRSVDPNQASLDLQPVLAANLFGQANVTNSQQLPLSSLNLVLTGVMAQGKSGLAFISVNGAPEEPFAVGKEITAGATLDAVHPDRIVLRRGGMLESVMLKDNDVTLPPGSIVTVPSESPSAAIQPTGPGRYSVDRQALAKSLTAESLTSAAVAPGLGGLVVRDIQPGGIFDKLGLRRGDVVRRINGQPVNGMDEVAKIYAQQVAMPSASSQGGRVTVEVMRGGKNEVLHYQMQ